MNTRERLIRDTAEERIYRVHHVDGYALPPTVKVDGDDGFVPDADGDVLIAYAGVEFWFEDTPVRVLIRKGADLASTIRLLRKIVVWAETHPEMLSEDGPRASAMAAEGPARETTA